jgi:hypothetical protein
MESGAPVGPAHDLCGLTYGEHLVISGLRRLVVRSAICRAIERAFLDACRDDAAEVLATFQFFVTALTYAARRRIAVGHPGSAALTSDERAILGLIGAAQRGDEATVTGLIGWFARIEAHALLALGTRALGAALAAHDIRLSAEPRHGSLVAGRALLQLGKRALPAPGE